MISKLRYILGFIKSCYSDKGLNSRVSYDFNKVSRECFAYMRDMEREDLKTEHFDSFVAHILGVYSSIISYHDSISYLCLAGHGLNSSILLRSQLESYLIFYYLISPKTDIEEIENRVDAYRDWVMIKMYLNSQKSKNFDLFTLNPEHEPYLQDVERNYNYVKDKYKELPELFEKLKASQSFLKDKRQIAKEADIEDLYLGIFTETSATVHLADISDRMQNESREDFDGYSYKFSSNHESMMISGVSNILLIKAINDFVDFFEYPKDVRMKLFKNVKLEKKHFA